MRRHLGLLSASPWVLSSLLACEAVDPEPIGAPTCARSDGPPVVSVTHYHGAGDRLGWSDAEPQLSPDRVLDYGLEPDWASPRFDEAVIDGRPYEPISYASPLYASSVRVAMADGDAQLPVVFAATSTGWVYAVAADEAIGSCELHPGDLLWRTSVARPMPLERLDGGVPIGVLSTPVLDLDASPPRIYVTALDADEGWQVSALDLRDGQLLDGWPITIDDPALDAVNTNGPARFWSPEIMSQRGALQLSPRGDRLYVAFGTFWGEGTGWIVGVDTQSPAVVSAFSSAPSTEPRSSGGIWGSAGPAIDARGRVWLTTGNSPPGSGMQPGVWGSSLLQLTEELTLQRAYSPFNYCMLDEHNMDLGASQPLLLPSLPSTSTPDLIAFGGKQGNVYLVDRTALPAAGPGRAPCITDASRDGSLLPPDIQEHFGSRGPLNVFGPYSDEHGQIDHAKMRTKLAYWRDADGRSHLLATGSTKTAPDSTQNTAPSIARLQVVTTPEEPAWLSLDAVNPDVVLHNPGSPIVSSQGGDDAVVWVIDRNAPRSASFLDPDTPGAIVYAFDARTLKLLWSSDPEQIGPLGKYGIPLVVDGRLIVASDRIQTFALSPSLGPPHRQPL